MKKGCFTLAAVLVTVGLLAFLAGPQLAEQGLRMLYPRPYSEIVSREAGEFGLEENLVYAVIRTESGFDPDARSRAGAVGLMQLTEGTFHWIASLYPPEDADGGIADPAVNIHCGCALLRLLLDHYGQTDVALCAYNAGMGNVTEWLTNPEYSDDRETLHTIPYPETRAYVKKVLRSRERYGKLYGED